VPLGAGDLAAAAAAGAVTINVIPHLVHGLSGEPFPTPFADPPGRGDSSPSLNILWASMNAGGAAALLYARRSRLREPAVWAALGVGATGAAFGLADYFGRVRSGA
jgi:hypothetical protein